MDTATILDMRNQITPQDLESIVRHQIALLREQPELSGKLPPLMIWGAPGVGKSSILRDIAKEAGIGFIDIRLAQREPVDIRGLPVPSEDSVSWLLSSDWPRDQASRGILLFDELTAADRTLQVAAYEII
ncbi:MAG: AAA family ATPase, partial [Lentisphaeria bacterium]